MQDLGCHLVTCVLPSGSFTQTQYFPVTGSRSLWWVLPEHWRVLRSIPGASTPQMTAVPSWLWWPEMSPDFGCGQGHLHWETSPRMSHASGKWGGWVLTGAKVAVGNGAQGSFGAGIQGSAHHCPSAPGIKPVPLPQLILSFCQNMHLGPSVPMVRPPVTSEVRILGRSGEHPVWKSFLSPLPQELWLSPGGDRTVTGYALPLF